MACVAPQTLSWCPGLILKNTFLEFVISDFEEVSVHRRCKSEGSAPISGAFQLGVATAQPQFSEAESQSVQVAGLDASSGCTLPTASLNSFSGVAVQHCEDHGVSQSDTQQEQRITMHYPFLATRPNASPKGQQQPQMQMQHMHQMVTSNTRAGSRRQVHESNASNSSCCFDCCSCLQVPRPGCCRCCCAVAVASGLADAEPAPEADADVGRPTKRKLFVGGLSRCTSEQDLLDYFSCIGVVEHVVVMTTPEGHPRGFGFIIFLEPEAAAIALSQSHWLHEHSLDLKPAVSRHLLRQCTKGEATAQNPHAGGFSSKLFVGGLPREVTVADLKAHFCKYGVICDAVVMKDQSDCSRGFGFVRFSRESAAEAALQDSHWLAGREADVKPAVPSAQLAGSEPSGAALGRRRGQGRRLGFGTP
mmetsp:Transcript_16379/g.29086  ORF Transcript_16379/g.29086 Transcript_16379/m.29086 type:complete len:419 (+) Transcript_16379:71-1327(+)